MNFYLKIDICIIVLCLFCYNLKKVSFSFGKIQFSRNKNDYSNRFIFLFISGLMMILVTGLRNNMETDYLTYQFYYENYISQIDLHQILKEREPLFALLEKIIGEITNYNTVIFMCVLAAITVCVLWHFFARESDAVWLCILVTLTIGSYYTCFNTTRNYMASILFAYLVKYIYKNKPFRYAAGILVVSQIHTATLAMLPMYWLLKTDWKSIHKRPIVIGMIFSYAAVFFGLKKFLYYINFPYYYLFDYSGFTRTSWVSLIRPAIFLLPVLIYRRKFDMHNLQHRVWFNSAVGFFLIQMLSTQYYIIYRFTYYMIPIAVAAMIYAVKSADRQTNRVLWFSMIFLFALLWNIAGQFTLGYSFYWQENIIYTG